MTSQLEASRTHKEIDGRGFGSQSFAILPKIREWDNLLQTDHQARAMVREIHPEVSFSALNGGRGKGLASSKKTQDGAARRTELLSAVFGPEMALLAAVLSAAWAFAGPSPYRRHWEVEVMGTAIGMLTTYVLLISIASLRAAGKRR